MWMMNMRIENDLCMSVKLGAFCTCIWEQTACGGK